MPAFKKIMQSIIFVALTGIVPGNLAAQTYATTTKSVTERVNSFETDVEMMVCGAVSPGETRERGAVQILHLHRAKG